MLTVRIPTMVSRTPHELMVSAEGLSARVRTTRVMAAAMTKAPEERRSPMTIFLRLLVTQSGYGALVETYLRNGT
jgi:hypothetical protein